MLKVQDKLAALGELPVNPGIGGGLRNLTAGFIRLCSAEAVSRSLRSRLPRMVATPVKEFEDTLWKAADKLRGSMDDSQYKDIVLGLVFLKYVTDAFDDARRLELEAEMQAEGASAEGKRGGEFYTPRSLVRTLVEILEPTEGRVYDPAVGSGSLLLKFAKVLGPNGVRQGYYGQEINLTTYNLARINMFLHDVNYDKFNIAHGDTLIDPQHWDDQPFDAIVSNPPYSTRWEGKNNPLLINDSRFAPAGVLAPVTKADLAFTMHVLSWLAVDGTAALVQFPGVLYRGGTEQKIRKYLVDNNYVDAVIQLPEEMFFGTTIAVCVLVLRKSKKDNDVLFIDASKSFVRRGKYNVMAPSHRDKIVEMVAERSEEQYVSKRASAEEIAANDYNLSVSSYVELEDTREAIDIVQLNAEIAEIVECQAKLRTSIDEIVAELEAGATK